MMSVKCHRVLTVMKKEGCEMRLGKGCFSIWWLNRKGFSKQVGYGR